MQSRNPLFAPSAVASRGEPGSDAAEAARPPLEPACATDPALDQLLQRIERLTGRKIVNRGKTANAAAEDRSQSTPPEDAFVPLVKGSLKEMGLTHSEVEGLVLKFLLARGDVYGRDIAEQLKLPFCLLEGVLRQMKSDQLVVYRGSNELNDYLYQLTDLGRERARRLAQICTYFGAAPVTLKDYVHSVSMQSIRRQRPRPEDLQRALADLVVSPKMLQRLGPAVAAGRGLFLYGPPGNGKSSVAKRLCNVFGKTIWIPRAICVDGEIVRVFDPHKHREVPLPSSTTSVVDQGIDRRWVRIERPTIIVGGELTMAHLEITENPVTHICEAPLQMKSNCGTLVVDDFGRQRIRIDELLNRWIVPLEDQIDFLSLPSGKTIQVPFDQLIIFSTNLEPRELVDEAFLRRIAYKIEITDPTEGEFRELFRDTARRWNIEYRDDIVSYVIEKYYRQTGRPMRRCHARDLIQQIKAYCDYLGRPLEMRAEYFDIAVENYFSIM